MLGLENVHISWRDALGQALASSHFQAANAFVQAERGLGAEIYPPDDQLFRALELTPLDQVRVVIIGQDPYHGPGQAHGLSFSVQPGVPLPSSLRNIYKEMQDDLGHSPVSHGFLESWARQGVLLLNTVLTVERGKPASHRKKGWEQFTDAVARAVSEKTDPVVFILWGLHAQEKLSFLDEATSPHHIIKSPHPSGLSAYRGFLGSRPFSRANAFLLENGRGAIDWSLPSL